MTNPQRTALLTLLKLSDLTVVSLTFATAVGLVIDGDDWRSVLELRVKVVNVLFLLVYLGYWHVMLRGFGLYRSYRLSPSSREWQNLGAAVVLSELPLWLLGGVLHFEYTTPRFFVIFTGLAFFGLGLERRLFRVVARSIRRHGRNLRNAIVVGDGDRALEMASRLARRGDLGYQIVEVIHTGGEGQETPAAQADILGRIATLLASQPVDEVFVALSFDSAHDLIRAIVSLCEEQGTTVRVLSSVLDLILARAQVDELDGDPVITIFTGPPESLHLLAKRLIDLSVSSLALVLLSPAFLAIALAIKLDSPGPVFFVHERVGLNGRRFRFYKFRTMVRDAEEMQTELEPLNEAQGPVFKIRDDPRITRVGRAIRRLSIDELPQLINVFAGTMSLVGPRPLPLRDVSRIDARAHRRRFSVKPGITCLWQIKRREPQFDDWVKTDMEYIDNWSLALDVEILLRTIPAVLSGRGAY